MLVKVRLGNENNREFFESKVNFYRFVSKKRTGTRINNVHFFTSRRYDVGSYDIVFVTDQYHSFISDHVGFPQGLQPFFGLFEAVPIVPGVYDTKGVRRLFEYVVAVGRLWKQKKKKNR